MAHLVLAEMVRKPVWAENSIAPMTLDLGCIHRGDVERDRVDGKEGGLER
jgi:hypothetical protein